MRPKMGDFVIFVKKINIMGFFESLAGIAKAIKGIIVILWDFNPVATVIGFALLGWSLYYFTTDDFNNGEKLPWL